MNYNLLINNISKAVLYAINESIDFDDEDDEDIFDTNSVIEVGTLIKYSPRHGVNFEIGQPIAICCISGDLLPDKLARFMQLKYSHRGSGRYWLCNDNIDFTNKLTFYKQIEPRHRYDPILKGNPPSPLWKNDINGKKNTDIIINEYRKYPRLLERSEILSEVMNYNPKKSGTVGKWYVPAFGELKLAMANLPDMFTSGSYTWSSTMYDNREMCVTCGAKESSIDYTISMFAGSGSACLRLFVLFDDLFK